MKKLCPTGKVTAPGTSQASTDTNCTQDAEKITILSPLKTPNMAHKNLKRRLMVDTGKPKRDGDVKKITENEEQVFNSNTKSTVESC
jgi:hypothetical protein